MDEMELELGKMSLEELREHIDDIDKMMLVLFEARMAAIRAVGAYKISHNLPVLAPERERALLEDKTARLKDRSLEPYALAFFQELMALSRAEQERMKEETHD